MAPNTSKLVSSYGSCVEVIHPWNESCLQAANIFAVPSFTKSIRFYATIYLISFLLKRRKPIKKDVQSYLIGTVRSAAFFYSQIFAYIITMCSLRKLLGKFYPATYIFIPTLISAFPTLHLERKSRRNTLHLFFVNLATETVFLMLESRGYVKRIKHGQILMLSSSLAILAYLMKCGVLEKDATESVLRFFWSEDQSAKDLSTIFSSNEGRYFKLANAITQWPKHDICRHNNGCLIHVIHGFLRPFLIGYALRSLLNLFGSKERIFKDPKILFTHVLLSRKSVSLGTTLGLLGGSFKLISCLLRWITKKDKPEQALLAGFIASLSFLRLPNTALAIHLTWKVIEIFYNMGVDSGHFPKWKPSPEMICALCQAIIVHAALTEPNTVRGSYMKFINDYTNIRLIDFNRQEAAVYENASKDQS